MIGCRFPVLAVAIVGRRRPRQRRLSLSPCHLRIRIRHIPASGCGATPGIGFLPAALLRHRCLWYRQSTICRELRIRGFVAYDVDEHVFANFVNRTSGQVDSFPHQSRASTSTTGARQHTTGTSTPTRSKPSRKSRTAQRRARSSAARRRGNTWRAGLPDIRAEGAACSWAVEVGQQCRVEHVKPPRCDHRDIAVGDV